MEKALMLLIMRVKSQNFPELINNCGVLNAMFILRYQSVWKNWKWTMRRLLPNLFNHKKTGLTNNLYTLSLDSKFFTPPLSLSYWNVFFLSSYWSSWVGNLFIRHPLILLSNFWERRRRRYMSHPPLCRYSDLCL